jgi:aminoglycoside 3-N-acetyltransferase
MARRTRYHVRQRLRPVVLERQDVVAALRAAGVESGDAVFFQSAMSAFGEIRGGSATVVAALEEVVAPEGLVTMPAFPLRASAAEYAGSGEIFDARQTPSTMGAITERFRKQKGALRSLHPTHSVVAAGLGAEEIIADHDVAPTPFGDRTPFARLIDRDALQVWFGCGVGPFTMYHAFECRRDGGFPLEVFLPDAAEVKCVGVDGRERLVRTLVHDPELARHRIDSLPRLQTEWRRLLLEAGILRSTTLGRGEILTVRLRPLMNELERLLARGVTIYDVAVAP